MSLKRAFNTPMLKFIYESKAKTKTNYLKKDRIETIITLEQEMRKIQAKKYITVSEFTEMYNVGKTSQQNYRGRLYDALPYHQKVSKGKIIYVVDEVEKWFANQHK